MPALDRLHNWFGLAFAYRLDGAGGGTPIGWADLTGPWPHGQTWLHLDLRHPNARRWLREDSGLDSLTVEALTVPRAMPRLARRGEHLLLVLKGIDQGLDAVPGDMVAARLWTDGRRLVSCQTERLRAVEDLQAEIRRRTGPADIGGIVADLADRLMTHTDDVLEELQGATQRIGRAGNRARHPENLVAELATLRRRMILMRFHLTPQRRALSQLAAARESWLGAADRRLVREVVHRCQHAIEGLVAAGDITEITQDEILQRSSETTERRVYSLTVITAIFLPLSFVTGLLGVNVAGIPDADDPLAFVILCLFLLLVALVQLWLLRRKGWL
ncbi:CorA family divalent cation transporter [uncultured Thiohalocapsa sp.]|uniref:CorA family divalent cation transporter n=1 Tax=uncultured Thiohalocapsa sp. TaxID=768990 RepID=UPI0025D79BB0|nr:CorA family divalent cation transporter [uncultured Thiohalocapsa sp.]